MPAVTSMQSTHQISQNLRNFSVLETKTSFAAISFEASRGRRVAFRFPIWRCLYADDDRADDHEGQ